MIKPASVKNGELVTEQYTERVRPFRKLVEWNYRDEKGELYAGVTKSVAVAEEQAARLGYKAVRKLWVLMLEDGTELVEGDVVRQVDEYIPEDGAPGYVVVEATAVNYTDLVTRDQHGNRWRACGVEDGPEGDHVTHWQPEARGSRA